MSAGDGGAKRGVLVVGAAAAVAKARRQGNAAARRRKAQCCMKVSAGLINDHDSISKGLHDRSRREGLLEISHGSSQCERKVARTSRDVRLRIGRD